MIETENRDKYRLENSLHEPRCSFGLVLNAEIVRLPEIMRLIEQVPRTRIIYQRISAARLFIIEEDWGR